MKRSVQTIAASVAMVAAAACTPINRTPMTETLSFTSKILSTSTSAETRVAGEAWEEGDAIGIYMLDPAGGTIEANASFRNVEYSTTGNGVFTPASEAEAIYINNFASPVSFIAYYPYTSSITSANEYQVNVSSQSDHSAIDLLWSNNATNYTVGAPVNLQFRHMLSKVVFTVTDLRDEASLAGATVTLKGANTTGVFNLSSGTVTSAGTPADIAPLTTVSGHQATASAIIIPATDASYTVEVTIPGEDLSSFTLPARDYAAGTTYLFNLEIADSGEMILVNGEGSIIGWNEVDGGTITIDKNDGEDPEIVASNPEEVAATATSVSIACQLFGVGTLSATGYSEWITAHSVVDNTVTFTLEPNTSTTPRSQTVTLTYATATLPVVISQAGAIVSSPLEAPAPSVEAKTPFSATLSWAAITGATGYEIAIDASDEAPTSDWVEVSATSHTFTGLVPANTYSLWVRATSTDPAFISPSAATLVTVTTEAGDGQPTPLFQGADFETAPASMNSNSKFTTITPEVGIDSSSALQWKAANSSNGNGTLFEAFEPFVVIPSTTISFWIKGTSTARGICIAFNKNNSGNIAVIGACNADTEITSYANSASYSTAIDTKGEWVKVTLKNIPVTSISSFCFRAGGNSSAEYDIVIDNIVIE